MAKRKEAIRTIEHDIFNMPIRKKSKAESRLKGATNERACAEVMGAWAGTKFTRTPGSGGLRWKRSRGVAADLVCEDPDFDFPFSVETKHLHRFDAKDITKIWRQVLRDAIRGEKLPLAMLRSDYMVSFRPYKYTDFDYTAYKDYYLFLDEAWGGMLLSLKLKPEYRFFGEQGQSIVGWKFSKVFEKVNYADLARSIAKGNYVKRFLDEHAEPDPEFAEEDSDDCE